MSLLVLVWDSVSSGFGSGMGSLSFPKSESMAEWYMDMPIDVWPPLPCGSEDEDVTSGGRVGWMMDSLLVFMACKQEISV